MEEQRDCKDTGIANSYEAMEVAESHDHLEAARHVKEQILMEKIFKTLSNIISSFVLLK